MTTTEERNRETRTGGIYIPPFRLAQLQKEITDKSSRSFQKMMWEILRKSLNGIINKVNVSNLQNIIFELFNENLLRGKGLLVKALLKSQMAAPTFTHVYAALIAVVNTKLPEIGALLVTRVILQFQRAYKRNDKLVCIATTKMIAHLTNQQVVHELLALEVLLFLLSQPTEDSVEIAADFMKESGQVLSEICPQGVQSIFERFRGILQEGKCSRRVQYTIENLMAIRKTKFKDHPGVIAELDLVEDADKITHEVSLDEPGDPQDMLNVFCFDSEFEAHEQEWSAIRKEIIGEEDYLGEGEQNEEELAEEENEARNKEAIQDFTDRDLMNLRKTVYLVITSSVDSEECANKLIKLKIRPGQEKEVCKMMTECCMHERTYLRFYGLLAQKYCQLDQVYQDNFHELFKEYYQTIHRFETNMLRNVAKFFAHLMFTDSIVWSVLSIVRLTEEDTTSSSRIFLKILFQEITEELGLPELTKRLQDPDFQIAYSGLFMRDIAKHTRFSINFFTSIGLGVVTEDLRSFLAQAAQMQSESSYSSSSSESESESESSESGKGSESGEDEEQRKNEEAANRFMRKEIEGKRRRSESSSRKGRRTRRSRSRERR